MGAEIAFFKLENKVEVKHFVQNGRTHFDWKIYSGGIMAKQLQFVVTTFASMIIKMLRFWPLNDTFSSSSNKLLLCAPRGEGMSFNLSALVLSTSCHTCITTFQRSLQFLYLARQR